MKILSKGPSKDPSSRDRAQEAMRTIIIKIEAPEPVNVIDVVKYGEATYDWGKEDGEKGAILVGAAITLGLVAVSYVYRKLFGKDGD